jgi:hypothetical protein
MIDLLRLHALRTEGILRVPGSAIRVKNVINELTSSNPNDSVLSKLTVNDVADLLKIFLRELPQPLLTHEYYQSFTQLLCNILFEMMILKNFNFLFFIQI